MAIALPKYALFDMDGTLIDNYEFHLKAWGEICEKYGAPRSRTEIIRDLHGTNFEVCQKFFGPEMSFERSEEIGNEKEARYREIYAPHIEPIAGLHEVLAHLQEQGVHLALGTMGNSANAHFVIEALELSSFFSTVHTAEDVSKGKPNPEIFTKCLTSLGAPTALNSAEVWIFEDTTSGIQAAVRAGGIAMGIRSSLDDHALKNNGASHTFADYQEVMNLLRRS